MCVCVCVCFYNSGWIWVSVILIYCRVRKCHFDTVQFSSSQKYLIIPSNGKVCPNFWLLYTPSKDFHFYTNEFKSFSRCCTENEHRCKSLELAIFAHCKVILLWHSFRRVYIYLISASEVESAKLLWPKHKMSQLWQNKTLVGKHWNFLLNVNKHYSTVVQYSMNIWYVHFEEQRNNICFPSQLDAVCQ